MCLAPGFICERVENAKSRVIQSYSEPDNRSRFLISQWQGAFQELLYFIFFAGLGF